MAIWGTTLSALLAQRSDEARARPALIDGELSLGRRELRARVQATLGWLRAHGIGAGDRVALWLVNRNEWLVLMLALARIGAALVAVNTRYRASELEYLLARSGARALIMQLDFRGIDFPAVLAGVDPARLPALERIAIVGGPAPERILDRPGIRFDAFDDTGPDMPAADGVDDSDPDALAILFTTSGTTRGPKLVMHSQRTLCAHLQCVARANALDAPDAALLAALPLCGTFGLIGALAALGAGAPVVLMDAFDGERAATLVREHAITHMFGSDEMYRRMLAAAPGPNPFPSARLFGYAAFVPGGAEFARDAIARGLPLAGLYGSSEVHALFSIQSPEAPIEARVEGGGRPACAQAEVRIRDLEHGALAAPGMQGEIEIRAPANFIGYFDDPQASADARTRDGFFRTGDIGRLRPDGSFVYETRRGDAFRLGGFLVNPAEIEDTIKAAGGLADVGVVALEIAGRNRAVAFAVPAHAGDAGAAAPDEAALIAHCARTMAGFKVPARIWFVERLPVADSANGTKLQRARLRTHALERLADDDNA